MLLNVRLNFPEGSKTSGLIWRVLIMFLFLFPSSLIVLHQVKAGTFWQWWKSLLPPCWRKHLNCGPNFVFCFVVVVLAINCFSAFVEIWYFYLLTAVKEMIAIMQDYGEVVCCVGSSFNSANPAIFIQADIGWVLCLKNSHSWLN